MDKISLHNALNVIAGQSGIQVCIGHNETIVWFDGGEYLRIERETQVLENSGWVAIDFNGLVKLGLSIFVAGRTDGGHLELEFEKGRLRIALPMDGFESISIIGRDGAVLFVA